MPMHFGKILGRDFGRANNFTNTLVDARSKEPNFKFSAVQIRPYEKPVEKIIVIGAGSAGLGFINSYRSLNKTEFLEYKDLIANGIELSDKRLELLRSGKKADPVTGKLVCSCNNVGEGIKWL